MSTIPDSAPNRNADFSADFLRTLLTMIELLEAEWRRPAAKASRRWKQSNPALDTLFRQAHRALAGLRDMQDMGAVSI